MNVDLTVLVGLVSTLLGIVVTVLKLRKDDNKEIDAKISNIVENYVSHYIYMSKATYENLFGEKYNTNVIFLKNVDLTEAEEDELITNLMSKDILSIEKDL